MTERERLAEMIAEARLKAKGAIAVGWNQTSVNGEDWSNKGGYDEGNDEPIPYNCLTMNEHYWLFDELEV